MVNSSEVRSMVLEAYDRVSRASLLQKTTVGDLDHFAQDLYGIPAYPIEYSETDFKNLFKKNALAKRIVNMYPRECWRTMPAVNEGTDPKETAFEEAWSTLSANPELKILENLQKADTLAGIGKYGILFLGLSDGTDLSKPAKPGTDLLYLRPFDQTNLSIIEVEQNAANRRYGLPLYYKIKLDGKNSREKTVHWTRVIHIAEDASDSPVYGEPRLLPVIEQVLNVTLLLKGSPHMFMRGGFPGFSFEAEPDVHITSEDKEAMKDEIYNYVHSMTRFLTLQGVKANTLQVQLANPDPYIKVQIAAISASTGIPGRMLMGSEMGHLASTADKMTFEDRIHDRQETFLTSDIIRPFVYRLQSLEILPKTEDEITVTWVKTDSTSQKERAEVSKLKAEALARYAGVPLAPMIVSEEHFLRYFLDFTPGQVSEILGGTSDLPDTEVTDEITE